MKHTIKTLQALADKNGNLFCKGRKTPTLRIFPDGTIVRADTDLTICKKMTVAQAVKTLALA